MTVSRLARTAIEELKKEGLEPSVDDIILLNELGKKAENNSEMFRFSALPRTAFLGDEILTEPCLAVRLWIDTVKQIFPDDEETYCWILLYAVTNSPENFPPPNDKVKIAKAVVENRKKFERFTWTQILTALDYVLGTSEDYSYLDPEKKQELDPFYQIPDSGKNESMAKQILCEALEIGISSEDAKHQLPKDIERLVLLSAINQGGNEVIKAETTKWLGRFYVARGKIRERLLSAKKEI